MNDWWMRQADQQREKVGAACKAAGALEFVLSDEYIQHGVTEADRLEAARRVLAELRTALGLPETAAS